MKKTVFAALIICLFIGYGEASKEVIVDGVRSVSNEGYSRVIVDLRDKIEFSENRLTNPDRIYFDLKNCILSEKAVLSLPIEDGILKRVRISQFNSKTVRIVIDLKEFDRSSGVVLENPYSLVIDVFGKKGIKPVPEVKQDNVFDEIKIVVIDPGHGGTDPGAIGPTGLMEKDVVLKVAKKVGEMLKETHGLNVIFTRDRDVFIPLKDRALVANSQKADLFISIHANASRKKNSRGIETYFLNWTADEESNRVAARENAISYEKMAEFQKGDFLQMILQDKGRDYKNNESRDLAGSIQTSLIDSLTQSYSEVQNLGVKWALFYVLVDADMPSVLVETSFISNRKEEKRLSDAKYIEKIAEAIASGVNNYIESKKKIVKRTASDNI